MGACGENGQGFKLYPWPRLLNQKTINNFDGEKALETIHQPVTNTDAGSNEYAQGIIQWEGYTCRERPNDI